jgi:hypothetical protein
VQQAHTCSMPGGLVVLGSRRVGPHEAREQLAHFDPGGAGRHGGVAKSEVAQAFLVIALDNAETPGSSLIEDGAEGHHLPGLDQRLPGTEAAEWRLPT